MLLVHPKTIGHGKWEVKWTWLPYFLAADIELIKHVDKVMTQEYSGAEVEENQDLQLLNMHNRVVELITEKYPIPGLINYLYAIAHVELTG
jgi:hypothetical protein